MQFRTKWVVRRSIGVSPITPYKTITDLPEHENFDGIEVAAVLAHTWPKFQ